MQLSFNLRKEFVDVYRAKPEFQHETAGASTMAAIVFYRTYSRIKPDGEYETWADVCERVINGMYSILQDHALKNKSRWNYEKAMRDAEEAYDRMFNFKWTPSGRGLWMMGVPFIHERKTSEALLNCAFVSTEDIKSSGGKIFEWVANMLMLGIGVAFDTRGAENVLITAPEKEKAEYVIDDSREGWAKSIKLLVDSYLGNAGIGTVTFDYSMIRPKGAPINGFGGTASGPDPLELCHNRIREYMNKNIGSTITSRTIVDISNSIGACVVAGNVRRSSQLSLGNADDKEYVELKNYSLPENEYRQAIGWASNNSVIGDAVSDYSTIAENIYNNGEPGVVWVDNMQKFARTDDIKFDNAIGTNPCAEIPLASYEKCNLSEIYLNHIEDEYDFQRTMKFAYLYCKVVSLTYEWITDRKSRKIMMQNRRVGVSTTGIAQFLAKHTVDDLIQYWDNGYKLMQTYDNRYSSWLKVPESIRLTCIKPSGSVSLLSGSTPGIHFPHDNYYIRRVRIQDGTPMLEALKNHGYHIEKDAYSDNTSVVSIPMHVEGDTAKGKTMWEQLQLAALAQKYWADNSVSVTISFDRSAVTKEEIAHSISMYADQLKCVSMLPITEEGQYAQMPYESISPETYAAMSSDIDTIKNLGQYMSLINKTRDLYCENDSCLVKVM